MLQCGMLRQTGLDCLAPRRAVGFGFQDVKGARMVTAQTPAMADLHSGEHGHDQASPGEIAIGVIIGRTSEFFDFFVFAIQW